MLLDNIKKTVVIDGLRHGLKLYGGSIRGLSPFWTICGKTIAGDQALSESDLVWTCLACVAGPSIDMSAATMSFGSMSAARGPKKPSRLLTIGVNKAR